MTNHLGNVLAVVSDKKIPHLNNGNIDYYEPDIVSYSDYYPFGMQMPGRANSADNYRYSFNGQEKDNEISDNSLDFGERIYNSTLGRFLSIDKKTGSFPWWSPFAFAGNTPIQAIDLDGLEIYYAQSGEKIGTYGTSTEVRVVNTDALESARAEFTVYTNALRTDPAATNEYLGTTLSSTGSVAFASYFTTVNDVTNDAALETYSVHKNCFTAAVAQLSNEGITQTGSLNALQTLVDNTTTTNSKSNNNANLIADPIAGAIYTQTQLNSGNPVMVGVKETKNDGTVPNPNNRNALTGHFVVIRSSNVAGDGTITFNYLDNASTSLGKNANNNFTLDQTSGSMIDNTVPARSNYQQYQVTEVRQNQ